MKIDEIKTELRIFTMKKVTIILASALLSMSIASAALSQSNAFTETPAAAEAVIQEQDNKDDYYFGKWVVTGFNFLTDSVTSGWNTMTDGIVDEWNTMLESILNGADAVETYIQDQKWDQKVIDAWNTLKTGASEKGSVAQEKLEEAYHTVRDYFTGTGEEVDQSIAGAVDAVAGAAGVAEAQVAAAYRTVENFFVENYNTVSVTVVDAWQTILESNTEIGKVSEEKLNEAFSAVHNWIEELGTEDSEEAIEAIELLQTNQTDN